MNVSPTQNVPETEPAEAQTRKPGREEFLNLLVAQLQHQDPLQPMDGTEFVTQLAQFSSVEQLVGINQRLGLIEVGQASAMNTQAAAFIGREVTVRSDELRVAEDPTPTIAFELEGAADAATVTLTDESGQVVGAMELPGPLAAGAHRIDWTGELEPGRYRVSVEASAAGGVPVAARGLARGTVTEVSFEHGYPELVINDLRVRLGDVVAVGGTQPAGL